MENISKDNMACFELRMTVMNSNLLPGCISLSSSNENYPALRFNISDINLYISVFCQCGLTAFNTNRCGAQGGGISLYQS